MTYLIGFFMTQFPYAAAAASLATDTARDLFIRRSRQLVVEPVANLLAMVAAATRKRR